MKFNKTVKINNRYKNKGVILYDGIETFDDVIQSWCFYTRFIFDMIENKSNERYSLIPEDGETQMQCQAEFKAFLKYWYEYANKTIPDDFKVTIKEFDENEN